MLRHGEKALPLVLLCLFFSFFDASAKGGSFGRLGVNYGTLGDDLPTAARSMALIQSIGAGAVKIYDANPVILRALAGTRLLVSIMVPNELIPSLGRNACLADAWVATYLVPFYPAVRVRYLLVGNEILSYNAIANTTWPLLVPTMVNIERALRARSIHNVKVGTTLAMDVLSLIIVFRYGNKSGLSLATAASITDQIWSLPTCSLLFPAACVQYLYKLKQTSIQVFYKLITLYNNLRRSL